MVTASRLVAVLCSLLVAHSSLVYARHMSRQHLRQRRVEAAQRFKLHRRASPEKFAPSVKNITFTNPKASQFYVDGTSIPEVDWDIGPSWSGLLPISNKKNESRQVWVPPNVTVTPTADRHKLFFWFFPPGPEGSTDDLIFWTNGGPGCSGLEGLLQENGPFIWPIGTAKPTINQYSWTNLSAVIYVEQPVGTGFSLGEPNIKNENGLAEQLVGFFQQFLKVFKEMKGKKFYLSGESYAGQYLPYIANYIYDNPKALDLNLQGIWIADPSLSYDFVQEEIPAVDFVHKYENVFAFNQTFLAYLDKKNQECGFAGYLDEFVKYPPSGPLPLPGGSFEITENCDLWFEIYNAAVIINPAFNIYRIFDVYPIPWDVLGFPHSGEVPNEQTLPLYYDRADVKAAIHAPNVSWNECAPFPVFPEGDDSLPTAFSVLPSVIERSNRTVIIHGRADFVLIAEGTRIVIQNMTWGGAQGFQTPIAPDSFLIDGFGASGISHEERGLAYYEVVLSGHMLPGYAPWAAVQSMQYLMGKRNDL